MIIQTERKDREFTPEDIERIAGVSRDLQRAWRKRGVLPSLGGKHAVFSLTDLIRLTVLRRCTQSGINIETAQTSAAVACMPVLSALSDIPGVVGYDGDTWTPEMIVGQSNAMVVGSGASDKYGFVPLPAAEHGLGVSRTDDLRKIEGSFSPDQFLGIVIDYKALAQFIADRADLPLVTVTATVKDKADADAAQ